MRRFLRARVGSWAVLWATLSSAFFATGCHAPPQHRFPSAESALGRLLESTSCARAVQGEARLSFKSQGRSLSGRVLYLAESPDHLRFDILSPFGVPVSTLTSNGARFSLYDLQHRSFVRGAASTCNVQRFTRVPVAPHALAEMLLGRPPLPAGLRASGIEYRRQFLSRGNYRIELEGDQGTSETIDLGVVPDDWDLPTERQRLRLLGVKVSRSGRVLYEVSLDGHRPRSMAKIQLSAEEAALGVEPPEHSGPECAAELASRMHVSVPKTHDELTLDAEELWLNPPLRPESFTQEVPVGVSVSDSSCGL